MSKNVIETLAIVVPIVLLGMLISVLVFFDNNIHGLELRFPRIPVPWSVHSKIRQRRAEVELANVETDLFVAKFERAQKEMVLMDLEDKRHRKALNPGQE